MHSHISGSPFAAAYKPKYHQHWHVPPHNDTMQKSSRRMSSGRRCVSRLRLEFWTGSLLAYQRQEVIGQKWCTEDFLLTWIYNMFQNANVPWFIWWFSWVFCCLYIFFCAKKNAAAAGEVEGQINIGGFPWCNPTWILGSDKGWTAHLGGVVPDKRSIGQS